MVVCRLSVLYCKNEGFTISEKEVFTNNRLYFEPFLQALISTHSSLTSLEATDDELYKKVFLPKTFGAFNRVRLGETASVVVSFNVLLTN